MRRRSKEGSGIISILSSDLVAIISCLMSLRAFGLSFTAGPYVEFCALDIGSYMLIYAGQLGISLWYRYSKFLPS